MKVDPERYLEHLRVAHNLPALTCEGVYSVNVALLDQIAEETIRGSMRIDAAEGAGLSMGGMLTIIPDLGILAAITIRMIQKLSLIYGFPITSTRKRRNPGWPQRRRLSALNTRGRALSTTMASIHPGTRFGRE